MQTNNVYYSDRPDNVMVTANGSKAIVDFPINVTEIEMEDGAQYKAEIVYSILTVNTPNLKNRVEADYDAWLEIAMTPEPQKAELSDVIEAVNALTEMIIGE